MKISGGSTKSLWDHLESKHPKEYSDVSENRKRKQNFDTELDKSSEAVVATQPKITSHFATKQRKQTAQMEWDQKLVRIMVRNNISSYFFDDEDIHDITKKANPGSDVEVSKLKKNIYSIMIKVRKRMYFCDVVIPHMAEQVKQKIVEIVGKNKFAINRWLE